MMRQIHVIVAVAFLLGTAHVLDALEEPEPAEAPTTEAPKIKCEGKGKVCVAPKLCVKDFVEGNQLERNYNYVSLR